MKNLTILPFTRNRYFYGKLLTAEDFEQEQRYVNDKRRLINRWLFGAGVVAGLEVIRVDDYTISVEMGLALDYTGREIVVDTPVIRKLSTLDGYEEATRAEGNESLYLCMEYREDPMEPVHNITNRAVHVKEEETYNKCREGYRLYVTDEEPAQTDRVTDCGDEARCIADWAEKIHQGAFQNGIHLAKIELVKAGDFYMIDQVIPVPFQEYVYHQPLLAAMVGKLQKAVEVGREKPSGMNRGREESWQARQSEEQDWQFAQGIMRIPVPAGGRPGRVLFSEEIPHGLGLGDVEIMLHVIQGDVSYGGAEQIFPAEEKKVEAAFRLKKSQGTFQIGLRALAETKEKEIAVGWTAIRRKSRNEIKKGEPRIYIQPGLVNMKTRESVQLTPVCVNMEADGLEWVMASPEGGSIDAGGIYHAPNVPGVYEVICRDKALSGVKASVFIVVRE